MELSNFSDDKNKKIRMRPNRTGGLAVVIMLIGWNLSVGLACERAYFGPRHEDNIACRCEATSTGADCLWGDELAFEWPPDDSQLVRVVSSRSGDRFRLDTVQAGELLDADNDDDNDHNDRIVEVELGTRMQQVVGYGGAFTDSAAMLLGSRLPGKLRAAALGSYFGPRGLHYNLARVPVGGTDMSWRPYSCNELAGGGGGGGRQLADDFQLTEFQLQPEDLHHKLPLIQQANELRRPSQPLRLMFSSWSAPDWMKTNGSLVQGHLKGPTGGPHYAAYARYILRYIREYELRLNVSAWALTPQNEPCTPGRLGFQVVNYNSVNFEPHQMADFLRLHLIPQLVAMEAAAAAAAAASNATTSGGPMKGDLHDHDNHHDEQQARRRLALFSWDDTLLGLERYRELLFADPQVYAFTRGLAVHWYSQGLDKLPYKSLFQVRRWLPHKFSLLSTEASFIGRPRPGDWSRGAKYARDIIENLRAGAVGWIDWNLALNMLGGPTWSGNHLDAAILVDEHRQQYYKNPMFYAIGHLTRFMRPGSHVLASQVYRSSGCQQQQQHQQHQQPANNASQPRLIWKMIDEDEEQNSELLVVAGELEPETPTSSTSTSGDSPPGGRLFWRQISLVLLNRSRGPLRARLRLVRCKSRLGQRSLLIELQPESITSLAFNC